MIKVTPFSKPFSTKIRTFLTWTTALGAAAFLASCSSHPDFAGATREDQVQLNRFFRDLENNLNQIWGVNEIIFTPQDLVKYSDNWNTRAIIRFAQGTIRFETVNEKDYYLALRNEIIYTLLSSEKPEDGSLYDTRLPRKGSIPFLVNQIRDNKNQPVTTIAQAEAFAQELLNKDIRIRRLDNGKLAYYVDINMIKNHLAARAKEYQPLVYKYAGQYDLDPRLMMAIMEVESAFNPYARSYSGAIGLMQIVPSTAGLEVFRFHGMKGKPTERYLQNPENNIRAAATYIYIMSTRYFQNITNPLSKRYVMTAGYNAGPGGTLTVFNKDRAKAIDMINSMTPQQVYNYITKRHYSKEAQRYLYKVSNAYKKY